MKKSNKKVLGLFISLVIILNIIFSYNILAATTTKIDEENKTVTITTRAANGDIKEEVSAIGNNDLIGSENKDVPWEEPKDFVITNKGCTFGGGTFTYEDLSSHGDYLCSERGTLLTGSSQPAYDDEYFTEQSGETHDRSELPVMESKRSQANYRVGERVFATPEEAFILAFAQHSDGAAYGEYTPAQIAWWNTPAGRHTSSGNVNFSSVSGINARALGNAYSNDLLQVKDNNNTDGSIINGTLTQTVGKAFDPDKDYNNLNDSAKDFQKYIMEAAGVTNVNDVQRNDDGYFKLDYSPKWVNSEIKFEGITYDCANPTTSFSEANVEGTKIKVGPFAIDYVDRKPFSYITNMVITTDDLDHKILEYGKDWVIENVDLSNKEYPGSNVPFYIVIKNKYNATKIKNIHVDFEYTNAKGAFNYFYGEIKTSTMTSTTTSEEIEKTNSRGETYYETQYTYHWKKQIGTLPSQTVSGNIDAEIRKYQTSIDRQTKNEAQIKVIKKIVDEQGKELDIDVNDFFDFKLVVEGAENSKTENIRVLANSSALSRTYYWEGDKAPTFRIQEINWPSGYEFVSIEPDHGTLEDGKTIKVIAKNKIAPKTGNMEIIKKAEENPLGKSNIIDSDDKFDFEVKITGKFKYNNGAYKKQTVTIPVSINADGKPHTVINNDVIKWYESKAPTYEVKEINIPEGVKLVSITPEKGTFKEGTTKVTAINDEEPIKGSISIIKTLEHAEMFTEEELKEKVYKFKLKVDGHAEEYLEAIFAGKDENNQYIWRVDSQEYKWLKSNEAPHYKLEEYDCPEGTMFDETRTAEANKNNSSIKVTQNGMEGQLVSGDKGVGVVDNYVINTVTQKTGKLKLIKLADEEKYADKDFYFVVTLKGTFDYKGEHFENQKIQFTTSTNNANGYNVLENDDKYNDTEFVVINPASANADVDNHVYGKGEWNSEEITWYGEAPEFDVQENLNGEDIPHSIEPDHGYLDDMKETEDSENSYLITMTAHNGDDRVGYIHIKKELENADKCSIDYVKSLKFSFKIHVDGYEDHVVTLEPKLIEEDNKWVWETEQDQLRYSWRSENGAPNYTIEEVDFPEGVTFVSANGEQVNKVEGQLTENKIDDIGIVATEASFINKADEHKGNLTIDKKVTHGSLEGKEFKFNVKLNGVFTYNGTEYKDGYTIQDVVVKGGSTWTSDTITWYGEIAPDYEVEEQKSDISEIVSSENMTGTITDGTTSPASVVTITNGPKKVGGYLQITKQIDDGKTSDKVFTLEIKINGEVYNTIQLKANEIYKSDFIEWNASEEAPAYEVNEINIPEGTELKEIINGKGNLKADNTAPVEVVVINKVTEKNGKFKITKEVVQNKLIDASVSYEFEMKIKISGTFKMNDVMHYKEDGDYEYTEKISVDVSKSLSTTYTSPNITWWGDEAPTVTVEEINLPKGWSQVGSPSNNGASLVENAEIEIVVTNELPVYVKIDLCIDLAGQVWEDVKQEEGKNTLESVPNGKIDENELGIKGVEVYVDRVAMDNNGKEVSRTRAQGYEDNLNSELTFPILTTADGNWEAPRLHILELTDEEKSKGATGVKYDVEFVYDGQTYEPTLFLSKVARDENTGLDKYVEGNADEYIKASTSNRDKFADRSMAKDYDRDIVNNRIQSIYGKTTIDGNGNTSGEVRGANNTDDIFYEAKVSGEDATRVSSKLITTNDDGTALDVFKTKARTSIGGLQYPFDNRMHLENYDINLTENGLEQKYKYSATYNYCLHVNLGLVRREDSDLEATKDLYSAKVIVNGKELTYRFNKLEDLIKSSKGSNLNRQVVDGINISYEVGLYSTDYYYRAQIYRANSELYNAVGSLYKQLGKAIEDSELKVYLTYKINLYNQSGTYVAAINEIDDYFDSSFENPIQTAVTEVVDGKEKEVANKSYMLVGDSRTDVNWTVTEQDINSSDGLTYNKMKANFNGLKLASGERAQIFVTFEVKKATIDGVKNAIELGDKSNIVEIANYSTYYKNGDVAGKIDKDSAPANVNIRNHNEKTWYEDDTDAAPVLELKLSEENRKVKGTAWEDKAVDEKTGVGNGVRDNDEALIGGLTTELIEKVKINNTEYDFLWPTNEKLDCLGGRTLEDLTGGFASTIETSKEKTDRLNVGEYEFSNVPTGNYVVRFLYGNNKTDLEDTSKVTLSTPKALKADGTSYYNDEFSTANYDKDKVGYTSAVYNGQDYKSTIYQSMTNIAGYVTNEWHDLGNGELAGALVSDARDSEARRLEVIANSQTITNVNGKVLATANDKKVSHNGLYNDYNMFADTAKVDLNIEAKDEAGLEGLNAVEVKGKVFGNGSILVEKESKAYTVNGIDFGLIERPETAIVLDKEINEIKLTTNDDKVIFDAKYDISYEAVPKSEVRNDKVIVAELNDDKYLIAKVELNDSSIGIDVLQALDKNERKLLTDTTNSGTQNFRFINVDNEILQGTTIEINCTVTALNVSEVDYTSQELAKISENVKGNQIEAKQAILELAKEIKEKQKDGTIELGKYLGTSYYTGKQNSDVVVKSKVRQLVDYVDNNAVFTAAYNTENDHMWRNTSITELSGSGYKANRLLDNNVIPTYDLVDTNGIAYMTDEKNNLILSIDSQETNVKSNAGFESELTPYAVSDESNPYGSQIVLTITKTVAAQDDADDLSYDHIAEIVKFENSVGRRDISTITGNANPREGEFATALKERDSSAAELVTFTPPTGNEITATMIAQILIITVVGLGILVAGVVIIKKKVLTK